MAMPNISDIVATTIEFRSKDIADNVLQHNAALAMLSKAGNVREFDGGSQINENISYAANTNAGSYSGYDTLPTAAQSNLTAAVFPISQYAVPLPFNGLEVAQNSGKEALINLVEAKVKVAEDSLDNLINQHIYLDGTGNNGKNLLGLAAAIPLANTNTYGGISRSTFTQWANQKFQASVDGAGVATTGTSLINYWNTFILSMTFGKRRPSCILAAPAVYSLYQSGLQNIQRVTDADLGAMGFTTLEFQGIPVVFDTAASGISSEVAYFVNTDFLHWRPHKDFNMVALDDKQAVNQDATVKTLVWYGNLTCSGSRYQGIFSNT